MLSTFWGYIYMSDLVRQAFRSLRLSPGYTLTVVLTLAIGIGLNAAIFTVIDCVLLRPLGYHDANRIVALRTHLVDQGRFNQRMGGDDYADASHDVHGLESTAYYQSGADGVLINGLASYVPVANVSPRFAEVMGVEPIAGRLFNPNDNEGSDALVSAAFAREHFGSARAAVGRTISYGGTVRPIVGVLPEEFSFPNKSQVWAEIRAIPENGHRTAYNQRVVGKRREGTSAGALAAELETFSHRLQNAYPEDRHKTIEAIPLQEQIVGKVRPTLNLLMGSVGVILLIVCANITHLQLIRGNRQLHTVAIRTALGATRATLVARPLMESLLLAIAGTVAALLLAVPALRLLLRLAPEDIPRLADVHLNADVFVFSFVVSALVMMVTALLPVWRSWHVDPVAALRADAARGSESRGASRLRDGLIVAEVALTLTLSASAVLLTRQLIEQSRQDLGFSVENLVTLDAHSLDPVPADNIVTLEAHSVDPVSAKGNSPPKEPATPAARAAANLPKVAHLETTLQSVANIPGVESVGGIVGAPLAFSGSDVLYVVKGSGQVFGPNTDLSTLPDALVRMVTPGLLDTLRVPLLQGRPLSADDRLGKPAVLLINQTLAHTIFPGQNPIGRQIQCGLDGIDPWWTIVGVVGDIRETSPADPASPTFYVPIAQHPSWADDMQFVVRTRVDPAAMTATLRSSLLRSHPEVAVKAATMRESMDETQRPDQFRSLLFVSFAAVSLLLAAVGMYGVTAYSVAQRRFEFSLRFALGANRAQVLGMVLRHALLVALIGIGAGVALSIELFRVLASVLGKLPPFSVAAYVLAGLAVLGIALCATFLPARRASTVDPMTILRSE